HLSDQARQAGAWANCMAVTHTEDPRALRLPMRLNEAQTRFSTLWVAIEARIRGVSDEAFGQLIEHPRLQRCAVFLRERRRDAAQKMAPELENLAVALGRDGLHAWGQLYDQISAGIQVPLEVDGEARAMSVGQAKILLSDPDRSVRQAAYEGLQQGWGEHAGTLATTRNSIIGSERTLYTRRGGDELTEALHNNRVERATIEAMMQVADEFQGVLVEYMQHKAQALGLDGLAWYDLQAPVGDTKQ